MKKIIIPIVLILINISCQKSNRNIFYPITENGKYGFIDSIGNKVIDCIYDYAAEFSDDYTLVINDTSYGYIDKNGKVSIPIKNSLRSYASTILTKDDKFPNLFEKLISHISNNPDTLFDYSKFDELNFSNGLAANYNKFGLGGYIDYNQNLIIDYKFSMVKPFKDSLAIVSIPFDGSKDLRFNEKRIGVIDIKGNFVVKPSYFHMTNYENGYSSAIVKNYEFNDNGDVELMNYRCFLINKKGNISYSFSSEINLVVGLVGDFVLGINIPLNFSKYIDINNKFSYNIGENYFRDAKKPIILSEFDGYTMEGYIDSSLVDNYYLFPVKIDGNNKWGLFPLEGKFKTPNWMEEYFIYDDMLHASENLIGVKINGFWGFINYRNEIVIPVKYTKIKSFKSGLAYVEEKQLDSVLKMYINKDGKIVYSYLEN